MVAPCVTYLTAAKAALAEAAVCVGLLAACSTAIERVSDPSELRQLAFLQAGRPARSEVEGRLGSPTTTYEDGRIAVYALRKSRNQFETASGGAADYRLVLVYGSDNTVDKWSLVYVAR